VDVATAFASAAAALGEHLAGTVGGTGGAVSFDAAWAAPTGAFPLPDSVPALLLAGLRTARPPELVSRVWEPRAQQTVRLRLPTDAPEARWGLDAASLRVLREAARPSSAGDLLARVAGADVQRLSEALRAIDGLWALGLLEMDGSGPLGAPAPTGTAERAASGAPRTAGAQPAPAPPAGVAAPPPGAPLPPRDEGTGEDPRVARLRDALARLETALPLDALEIQERRRLTAEEVSSAFRDVSKRYHPDLYHSAPPGVRRLAEACFARVNVAYEALQTPGGLAEARRALEARAAGLPYVSERDHQVARVAFRRGEMAARNREWAAAYTDLAEAARLDPVTWPHALSAAHAGYLARALGADEAVAALDALVAPNPAPTRRAEIDVAVAQILKLSGKPDAALARFRAALAKDPENRDAQRELRLHERRSGSEGSPTSAGTSVSGLFAGLFGKKR
jgi:hypothetical protein